MDKIEKWAFIFAMVCGGICFLYLTISGVHSIGDKLDTCEVKSMQVLEVKRQEIRKDHEEYLDKLREKISGYDKKLDSEYGCIMTCGK